MDVNTTKKRIIVCIVNKQAYYFTTLCFAFK